MQMAFGFGAGDDLTWVRDQLRSCLGDAGPIRLRTPIGQLVKSMISGRTHDEVSLSAYDRLVESYPRWFDLSIARPEDVEAIIGEVTYPDVKARHLGEALRLVAASHPDSIWHSSLA